MATPEVIWDGYVSINGVDQSDHCKGYQLPRTTEELDAAVMGGVTKIFEPGLLGFSPTVSFLTDYTDDQIEEQLEALWAARTKFAVAFRKSKTDAISAGNPEYQFTGFVAGLTTNNQHGSLSTLELTLSTNTAMTRDITP